MGPYETTHERLDRLRRELAVAQDQLIEAEANLADELADINAFEAEVEARLGDLMAQLNAVESELREYHDRIQQRRNRDVFGTEYRSVDEQFRRTWERPSSAAPKPPPKPPTAADEVQIKKLYRKLARRFHPDLAADDADRAYRTEKMTAINDAYAARSLPELLALAREMETAEIIPSRRRGQTEDEMVQVLQKELARCRRRLREIDLEVRTLHNRHSVQLALEVKLAQREGRDLLAEMAADLERKIARKTVERDMIKTQFDDLDSTSRIIR